MFHILGHYVLFICFRSEKSNERAKKKTFKKKNIEPVFGKVNEGDEIKKTVDKFLEKLMRATK